MRADDHASPVWHPFTQHALVPEMVMVRGARDALLAVERDGRPATLIDAISSWWVITHGHCHPRIADAVKKQVAQLDQVIFAGFTHEPAERLARALVALAPAGLDRVFYSDSGSTAVEVALKMALGYWRNIGRPRNRIVALEHAYHGDTIGTMSAGARGVFNAAYEPLLFAVDRLPFPATGHEQRTLDALEELCRGQAVAALLVEPLILGAGGMLVWPGWVLAEMRRICDRTGVLLIADEVMTGWGRTGTAFACAQAGVVPDILCTAKGLTGGLLPLAATLCKEPVFAAHYAQDRTKTFFHSSSYTANPIACAAALENLAIWHDEPVLERISALGDMQAEGLAGLDEEDLFRNPRRCGTITAVDLAVEDAGYLANVGPVLQRSFIDQGVLLRPLGNTIYVMPPYCTTPAQLGKVYATIKHVVAAVMRSPRA